MYFGKLPVRKSGNGLFHKFLLIVFRTLIYPRRYVNVAKYDKRNEKWCE